MQIRYDAKGQETITFTTNEKGKLTTAMRLLSSLSRATGDDELRQAVETVRERVPLLREESNAS